MKKIIFATFALSCPINSSLAEPLDFPSLPLFMGEPVTQNAFILLDDSGSMDWEIVTGRYWDPCAYDPNFSDSYNNIPICGTLIDNYGLMRTFANKTYRNFSYIYANNDNLYGSANNCTLPEYNTLESCSIVHLSDWRMLSSSLNLLYYNPTVTYLPWPGNCNQNTDKDSAATCKNAEFTAARAHPKTGNIGFNLIKDLSKNNLASYHVWIDNKGFNVADKRPLRASKLNVTDTPNQVVDLWDSHLQIVFKDNNTVELTQHYYQPTEKDIGHKTEKIATLSDTKACYNILGPDITQPTATNGTGCQTILQAQQNFANWYQYHRKKSYVANNALAVLISKQPTFKFGLTTLNQSDKFFIEIPSSSSIIHYQENNQNLLNQLWDIPVVANNTPLRTGLDKVGQYYAGALPNKKSPITSSCQKNMALLLTDGYWNEVNLSNKISDTDKDNIPFTLSDIARYYYLQDLSDLANNVTINSFDTASWQHLSTVVLHFGNTLANPSLKENSNWGNPYFSSAAKVSDLWHAAYNSKGMNASVFNPQALVDKLTQLLPAVQNRLYGGTASAIVNNKAMAYFTRFNSPSWTGELLGYEITPSGLAKTPAVHATIKNHLDHNSRVILTKGWSKTDKGAPFRLPANFIELKTKNQLSDAAAAFLNYKVTEPEVIINYLRGDSLQEQSNNGPFRNRTSLIGDIIHSQAVYIGEPARFYPDTIAPKSYSQFKTQYASRAPLIYIGANDGMLHGFHAQTGEEKLAYIPGMHDIFSRLPNLTLPSYQHAYWVDGPLTEADVFIHNQWQTILVGTAGQGAKGIFALNVTDPSTFSEKNAQSIFLWEFTDKDDAGMGYLLTQPYITKLRYRGNEYKWAVLFGNGYQTNESALYILFIDMAQDGTWKINTDYLKIAVPSNSNQKIAGLTSIYPVDINGDFITDYIYAADLNGHIWKFDLNDANPENWKNKVNLFFTATFAEAGDQPISAPLVVTPHPLGKEKGVMVYFGTGKYLEPIDNTITHSSTQSFYGLWDKLDGSAPTKNALLKQTILNEIVQNEKVFRHVSNSAINWNNQHTGWYLDFFMNGAQSNQGEKTISRPLIHNGKVLFTTLLPNQNPCEFGGHSWLMSLNAENGGGLMEFSFDLNGDNKFDYQDKIITDNQGNNATPAGLLSPVGILATPTLFSLPNKTENMILLNGQTGITAILEKTGTLNTGRKQKKVIK